LGACLAVLPATPGAASGSLEIVGRDDLGRRGLNAGLALAGSCAFVGSRGAGPVAIVDVSDPARPRVAGQLAAHANTTARELRAVADGRWLVVLEYALGAGGTNQLAFYRWTDSCLDPRPAGTLGFGARGPHEMYLWRDPARPARVLLFVSMFSGGPGDLQVVDASDPAAPSLLSAWPPPGQALVAPLHSIALDVDGRRAYLADWTGGLLLADASEFADARPEPGLRLLTSPAGAFRTPPGNVHSAVPVPGRPAVIVTDERYPRPAGSGCPYGPAHLVDVSDPGRPAALGRAAIAENEPARCAAAPVGTWTSHNATLTEHLALVTWYSGGLLVFDISDLAQPQAVASLRPEGPQPHRSDPGLGATAAMTWSYPVIREGLIYIVDINQGLFVLRYEGPYMGELKAFAFAEGNSNLTQLAAAATPSLAPSPSASPTQPGSPPSNSAPTQARRPSLITIAQLAGLLAAALVAALGYFRARRKR
jgi:hypothetical protein